MTHPVLACRSCGQTDLTPVLFLGKMPLADRLLADSMLADAEPALTLTLHFCAQCALVQIAECVAPEQLFCEDYPYYSSFSDALLKHSRDNAKELIEQHKLGEKSLVVELASNDGYLLKNFIERGIPVLGIDPAEGPAKAARDAGVETMCAFFTEPLARELASSGRRADVIIGNNVLAHVPDLNGFVAGIGVLLKQEGVAVIEVPYVKDLIDHCEFDTIYHEHLCYFSVTALRHLFARHSLSINDVRRLSIHGGSLRLYVGHKEEISPTVDALLEDEQSSGVDEIHYYEDFAQRVEQIRESLLKLLRGLKDEGKRIAAYGAAAKGATLINYVGIGSELLDFVVDRNTHKQGRYMPGQHIPILPCDTLVSERPDYCLLLAWNFAEEIMNQQAEYIQRGGRFIVPIPAPRIIQEGSVEVH